MKYYALIVFTCLFTGNAFAQEGQQRIPDLSLSPEDSLKQPSSNSAPAGIDSVNNPYQTYQPNKYQQGYSNDPVQQRMNEMQNEQMQNEMPSANSFMAGYCDPNAPIGIANPAMQSCLAATKHQSCDLFNHLPVDAQQILDHSISCVTTISETDGTTPTAAAADPSCNADDRRRLMLLKKYWNDQNTAYALVFLPDMVLNDSVHCMNGGR